MLTTEMKPYLCCSPAFALSGFLCLVVSGAWGEYLFLLKILLGVITALVCLGCAKLARSSKATDKEAAVLFLVLMAGYWLWLLNEPYKREASSLLYIVCSELFRLALWICAILFLFGKMSIDKGLTVLLLKGFVDFAYIIRYVGVFFFFFIPNSGWYTFLVAASIGQLYIVYLVSRDRRRRERMAAEEK